jgi:nucleoside-diphosphate-sugar epimerase
MSQKTVLVAGASGLVGLAAVRRFLDDGWGVIAVSRREPPGIKGARFLSVDLLDEAACEAAFSAMPEVTHVVYAALQETPGLFAGWIDDENIARNGAMLRNLFEPLRRVATGLQHVSLLHGTKAYGIHHPSVGAKNLRIPLKERDPRRPHPNFYFVQEEYLLDCQQGASWGLSVFRPTVIYGDAAGNNMNPIPVIAAYAALLRSRGEPLHFPGANFEPTLREAVDADLVASALAWAAESPAARGETFNLTNGDVFSWPLVWPAIAEEMGMEMGEHRPLVLAEELPARAAEWAALVDQHRLAAPRDILAFVGANSLVYTDGMLGGRVSHSIPALNSTIKGRLAGFHDCMDSEDMFRKWFRRLAEQRLIPPA